VTKIEMENAVFVELTELLNDPMNGGAEFVSVPNLVSLAEHGNKWLDGMTGRDVRNACRRLKRKGLVEHGWDRYNPDQPSGEYGEVWSGEPFIPRHGYGISNVGRETELYKTTKKRVLDEWDSYWCRAFRNDEEREESET